MGQAPRELLSRSSRSLAEGFFATGVVLIEGRSDKAALTASAQVLGLNFEAAGIAVLSAEGKETSIGRLSYSRSSAFQGTVIPIKLVRARSPQRT